MGVRLVIEVDAETYERVENGSALVLEDVVTAVEVRQQDGLLHFARRVRYAEGIGAAQAHTLGLPPGSPAIRAFLAPKED